MNNIMTIKGIGL